MGLVSKACLLTIILLPAMLLASLVGSASENQSLFLNVYVGDVAAEKALVVGYDDNPEGLPFFNATKDLYEDGQLYAVTESLLYRDGQDLRLEFPVKGYYDEYHVVFYIPGEIELTEISCSQGIEFLSSIYDGSLVLDLQGFDLTDPVVSLDYKAS
ncbi:MAG: hypothetical protein A4E48_00338 [Methanosaeta sp. PtaU1.Bin060]|nr:MAG: hypothetical protein A4E48_00338 [Methanosaeta sp. PtaU1.Bin060]